MKTLRLVLISVVAVASASASFAGHGANRGARATASSATAPVVTAAPASEKCESMIVKQGKRTSTVKCDGTSSQCKAECGS